MSILDFAKSDYASIVRDANAFSKPLKFIAPNAFEANIIGHGMSHHISFGTDGQVVNGKNSHVTFVEKDLVDTGYPVRDAKNKVSLYKHTVSFSDSNGVESNYNVIQVFPDETLGLLTLILAEKNV